MTTRAGIGIYAPSGFSLDPAALDRAVARLEARGYRVVVDPTCRSRWQRFAAPDAERLAGVLRMAADPHVDIAITLRGGYGWSRLLRDIDFPALAATRKRWLGYSDFTAFALGALALSRMTTLAGPVAASDFGAETPCAFTLDHCFGVLDHARHDVHCVLDGPDIAVEGTLWGGNLAMVAHLVGTPYMPVVEGGILFLEDVGEIPYRVERMFAQLLLAGIVQRQRAVVLGQFTEYALSANDGGYDMASAIAALRDGCDVPVLTGLPFGHVREKLTLPVGGHCALQVRGGAAHLALSDYGC
ncbi:MAG: LD-carboxypeptidase [Betaproteobacteria bacterium]